MDTLIEPISIPLKSDGLPTNVNPLEDTLDDTKLTNGHSNLSASRDSPFPTLLPPSEHDLGPAATSAQQGILDGPSSMELLADVSSNVAGSLELEERAGGPPMPPAGIEAMAAGTTRLDEDVVMSTEPVDTVVDPLGGGHGMPGHASELGVHPDDSVELSQSSILPTLMSADVDQPVDLPVALPIVDTSLPLTPAEDVMYGVEPLASLPSPAPLPPTLVPATDPSAEVEPELRAVSTIPTPPKSPSPLRTPMVEISEPPLAMITSPEGPSLKRASEGEVEPPTKRLRTVSPYPVPMAAEEQVCLNPHIVLAPVLTDFDLDASRACARSFATCARSFATCACLSGLCRVVASRS